MRGTVASSSLVTVGAEGFLPSAFSGIRSTSNEHVGWVLPRQQASSSPSGPVSDLPREVSWTPLAAPSEAIWKFLKFKVELEVPGAVLQTLPVLAPCTSYSRGWMVGGLCAEERALIPKQSKKKTSNQMFICPLCNNVTKILILQSYNLKFRINGFVVWHTLTLYVVSQFSRASGERGHAGLWGGKQTPAETGRSRQVVTPTCISMYYTCKFQEDFWGAAICSFQKALWSDSMLLSLNIICVDRRSHPVFQSVH